MGISGTHTYHLMHGDKARSIRVTFVFHSISKSQLNLVMIGMALFSVSKYLENSSNATRFSDVTSVCKFAA